jgi:hypothetical protein
MNPNTKTENRIEVWEPNVFWIRAGNYSLTASWIGKVNLKKRRKRQRQRERAKEHFRSDWPPKWEEMFKEKDDEN